MVSITRYLGAACLALLISGSVRAETMGFSMTVGGSSLLITNLADLSSIDELTLTIGNTAYNWDHASPVFSIGSPGSALALVTPDSLDDGVRSDILGVTFVSFLPGDQVDIPSDIDPDSTNSGCCQISGVLFNNGDAPNAVLTLTFSNDYTLEFELGDTQAAADDPNTGAACTVSSTCAYGFSFELPEPELALLVGALAAALAARRRSA